MDIVGCHYEPTIANLVESGDPMTADNHTTKSHISTSGTPLSTYGTPLHMPSLVAASEGRPNADTIGALAALRRAALKAQREAIETVGSFPIWKDGKVVYVTEVQFNEEDIARAEAEERVRWGLVPPHETIPASD